jgi:hypothetical protein
VGPRVLAQVAQLCQLPPLQVSSEMLIALPGAEVPWYLWQQPWWDFRRAATMVEAAGGR